MAELTPEKLAELRQKAEAAETQGPSPWMFVETKEEYHTYCEVRDKYGCQVVDNSTQEEADYIAAADPATVLTLVEEIERLRALQCWVIMRKDNRDQVFDGPFFTAEDAKLHVPDSLDYEYTVEPWTNQANVIESEAGQ